MFFGMNGFGPCGGCGENRVEKNDCTCLLLLCYY